MLGEVVMCEELFEIVWVGRLIVENVLVNVMVKLCCVFGEVDVEWL